MRCTTAARAAIGCALLLLAAPGVAQASTYETDFEPPVFAPGASPGGVDG